MSDSVAGVQVSNVIADCAAADLAKDSRQIGICKGQSVKILLIKDLSQIAEFSFPEEITNIQFSPDSLKFFVINK